MKDIIDIYNNSGNEDTRMLLDLSAYNLPAVFNRNGKACYLDPIGKRLMLVTPEETIRQRTLSYLVDDLLVPPDVIRVEQNLSRYGLGISLRADIVIHKRDPENGTMLPLAVVECKAPNVMIDNKCLLQLEEYANQLECDYAMITNGETAFCYKYDPKSKDFPAIKELPLYPAMLAGVYEVPQEDPPPHRIPFKELSNAIETYQGYDIGTDTKKEWAIPSINLLECFLDVSRKIPRLHNDIFDIVEDLGIRLLTYGNASGGQYSGPYRSFLIDVSGNAQIVSFAITSSHTWSKPITEKTSLIVAIDTDQSSHHSLQLVIDDNMGIVGNQCIFHHHGRIGISNIGSGKINELRAFVMNRYSKIIDGKEFYLGTLTHDRLWFMDDPEIVTLISHLIIYALLRDEYRGSVLDKKRKQ